ncbi:hypothetical protein HY386_00500 [Candidatus Daviesbacteria bacterium]|nr:hypothetical protein [Candidatus Daviesbacteria bacterium]
MDFSFWGFILTTIGELLIGISVLRVHIRIKKERKIDKPVLSEIKHEVWLVLIGIIFIVAGFLFQLPGRL